MTKLPVDIRLRLEWAKSALFALEHCRPEHADAICTGWLQASATCGPKNDPFGMCYSDARLWVVVAPQHELMAYTLAGLERLSKTHLTLPYRKTAFKALWRSLPDNERISFIQHVNGRRS